MTVSLPFSNSILMSSLYLVLTWTLRASHEVVSRSAESWLPKSKTWGPSSLQAPSLDGWAAVPGNGAMTLPLNFLYLAPLPELPLPLGLAVMVLLGRWLDSSSDSNVGSCGSITPCCHTVLLPWESSVQCHVPLSLGIPATLALVGVLAIRCCRRRLCRTLVFTHSWLIPDGTQVTRLTSLTNS
jgi:hypothetical protein